MFDDIGEKIQTIAGVVFILAVIGAVIGGGYMIIKDHQRLLGAVVLLGGLVGAYILSAFIYGFGELIDNSAWIEEHTRYIESQMTMNKDKNNKT